ncbi:TrbC/VirB2 family protein [Xanthobacter sp. V13C-7B]|uniref:TrbC/VirB2 family protein n=1 Tax=Xanthobacter variabilis TaxID=3119932 RepID=UPI0037265A78
MSVDMQKHNGNRVPVSRRISAAIMMGVALTLVGHEPAFAQASGIQSALEQLISLITGGVGKALATLAIMGVGIAWMFNVIQLRTAGFVVFGIAIVFSAATIAGMLGAS